MSIKVIDSGPDLDPEEIKRRVDLRRFVAPSEVVHGDKPVVVFCRWHNDRRTPNLYVYRESAHCFACGCNADLFEFLELEYPGVGFHELLKIAADLTGTPGKLVSTVKEEPSVPRVVVPKPPLEPLDPGIAEKFHQQLGEKRQWFRGRGLSDALIDSEQLGYRGSAFTIPVWSREGKLLTVRFRRDDSVAQKGQKYWGWRDRNDVLLYNAKALDFCDEFCCLCEGELDALRLWDECLPAVSATNGAGAFSEALAAELWRVPVVVICYDSDDAGRKNAERVAGMFPGRARVLDLAPAKDVTDWLRDHDADEFRDLIEKAGALGVRRHWTGVLKGDFWQ